MRRLHREIASLFAALLLVVGLTGVVTRVVQTIENASAPRARVAEAAAGARLCRPEREKRSPLGQFGHLVKDIHSGEALGPVGVALALASGVALCFFAVSGFWIYWQMWLRRRRAAGAARS